MTHTAMLTRAEIESMGPPVPEEVSETDVPSSFLCDLALKHVAQLPEPTTDSVACEMRLPRTLAEELLQHLFREKLIEVRQQMTMGATRYAMLDRGWERVARVREMCGYAGPAPVSLRDYAYMMRLQAVPARAATMEMIRSAFRDLILPESLMQTLGCVVNSRRSLFLSGPAGTGKTAVAERVNAALPGAIWVPHALEIDGQVIRVFDAHNHRPLPEDETPAEYDRRWVCVERPLVIVGGELTLENADLQWSETARFYEAPFQLKANGGTLVIDDFGRQRVAPVDLLNRWIVPLERKVDYLALQTGKKLAIPFDVLIVFSTNLDPKSLVDDAFLRRIRHKIEVPNPTPNEFREIFRLVCKAKNIQYSDDGLRYLLQEHYLKVHCDLRCCHPRDLCDQILDEAKYRSTAPEMSRELIDRACDAYFVKL